MILEELASDAVLDHAYAWLCERRKRFPSNAEVWAFRHRWQQEKARKTFRHCVTHAWSYPYFRHRLRGGQRHTSHRPAHAGA